MSGKENISQQQFVALCSSPATDVFLGKLRKKIIGEVVSMEEASGYLNTYNRDDRKSLRTLSQTQTLFANCRGNSTYRANLSSNRGYLDSL